ncbi:MAG: aldehyde dehydrogenase family protein, partial [Candidatus Aminicenantes bacterium]|nr:aldehyde dehydrogenase family protein [Candidatus Aminicenantes bacterium]
MKDEFSLRGLDIEKIMDQAVAAAEAFRRLGQAETDKIVEAVYKAGFSNRVRLAKLACEETKLGRWEDKVIKNVIATRFVYQDIKNQKTVGLIADDPDQEIVEIAEPVGPIFAITPV